jgi:hypothetical protein
MSGRATREILERRAADLIRRAEELERPDEGGGLDGLQSSGGADALTSG